MGMTDLIGRQITQIQQGGRAVLFRKMKAVLGISPMLPLYILAVPAVAVIRLIKSKLLVRIGILPSDRIGHFIGNTEMYLCEMAAGINKPKQRYVDIFYMARTPACNQQLAIMWKRVLRVWPAWILSPIMRVNQFIPGYAVHEIGDNTQTALDVHNLLDRFPPHLYFTAEEVDRGEAGLLEMGIPAGAPFVCLNVRDNAYMDSHLQGDWSYHNYRDSNIQNYVLTAEELAKRGYFVLRMGAKVGEAIKITHPKVIDYATNGMRSDFMDIYLGAKCAFCISTGTGWDSIPEMTRRPIVYVNMLPVGLLHTFRAEFLSLTKRHVWRESQKTLTLKEIFASGVGYCLQTAEYESKGVQLVENTPEEICDVAVEMAERLNGVWQEREEDEYLQRRFWEIFPTDAISAYNGRPLHGEIRARFGASFLRNNRAWLQ